MNRLAALSLVVVVLAGVIPVLGNPIDFEDLTDGTIIGSNYAAQGVLFQNAVIATAGISLNEFEFPPYSGVNVAIDALGPMTLIFTTPVSMLSGYLTYAVPLTLTAYGAGNTVVATGASLYSANYISSGNPPNELISLNFAGGIRSVSIVGDPLGNSFALDDLSFIPIAVPEPSSIVFFVSQIITLAVVRQRYVRGLLKN